MGGMKDLWDGGQSTAWKKNEANAAALKGMLETQYGLGMAKWLEALGAIDTGHANAMLNLDMAGETATAQILENQEQVLGGTKADMVSAGLSGTTVGSNLNAQTAKGTSMALAALQEALGGQKAGIELQTGSAKAGVLGNIANFAMNKVGQAADITPHYQGGTGLAAGLGQALGSVGGAFAGKALGSFFEGSEGSGDTSGG